MRNSAASRSLMTPGSSGGPSRWASSAGVGVSASSSGNPAPRGCSNSTVSPCRFAITRPRLLARWMTPGANRRPAAAVVTSLTVPLPNVSVPGSRRSNDGPVWGIGVLAGVSAGKYPRYLCTLDRSVVYPACLAAELTKHPDHPLLQSPGAVRSGPATGRPRSVPRSPLYCLGWTLGKGMQHHHEGARTGSPTALRAVGRQARPGPCKHVR